jgi:hypothetical protein
MGISVWAFPESWDLKTIRIMVSFAFANQRCRCMLTKKAPFKTVLFILFW